MWMFTDIWHPHKKKNLCWTSLCHLRNIAFIQPGRCREARPCLRLIQAGLLSCNPQRDIWQEHPETTVHLEHDHNNLIWKSLLPHPQFFSRIYPLYLQDLLIPQNPSNTIVIKYFPLLPWGCESPSLTTQGPDSLWILLNEIRNPTLKKPKPFSALTYNDHHNLLSLSPCTVGKYKQRFSHGYLVFYLQTACLELAWLLVFPDYWSIELSNLFGVYYLYDNLKRWASRKNLHYLVPSFTFYEQFSAVFF